MIGQVPSRVNRSALPPAHTGQNGWEERKELTPASVVYFFVLLCFCFFFLCVFGNILLARSPEDQITERALCYC